ncbi:MAG TPA: hypothetical protein VMC43_00090 [Candidatus Paceibacterota bacterium]|nr:hypothetical protein [Candidatus Paceibacterota bacterium]
MTSRLKYTIGSTLLFLASPLAAFAVPKAIISTPGEIDSKIICPIANFFFTICLVVSILMILYSAYLYMTAAGDTTKVKQAGQTIIYAAVGLGLALLANSAPALIADVLGDTQTSPC